MLGDNKNDTCDGEDYIRPASKTERDLEVQLVLSLILGIGAFIAFCVSWEIPSFTALMLDARARLIRCLVMILDSAPAMADSLCCAQEAP